MYLGDLVGVSNSSHSEVLVSGSLSCEFELSDLFNNSSPTSSPFYHLFNAPPSRHFFSALASSIDEEPTESFDQSIMEGTSRGGLCHHRKRTGRTKEKKNVDLPNRRANRRIFRKETSKCLAQNFYLFCFCFSLFFSNISFFMTFYFILQDFFVYASFFFLFYMISLFIFILFTFYLTVPIRLTVSPSSYFYFCLNLSCVRLYDFPISLSLCFCLSSQPNLSYPFPSNFIPFFFLLDLFTRFLFLFF